MPESESNGQSVPEVLVETVSHHRYSSLQPKFKDCSFDSAKKPEYLLTWIRLLTGIIRNIPRGDALENFLDNFLGRKTAGRTTRPSFLSEAGMSIRAPGIDPGEDSGDEEPEIGTADNPSAYHQLHGDSMALDKTLFHTLFTIVQGPYLDLITDLTGDNARYTFAIVAMWRHGELGSSTRRVKAMTAMQELSYHGDPAKWKLDFLGRAREIYASKLTIEHFIVHCAFHSFEGKNQQVQAMIAGDINSDKVGPDMSLEALAGQYSTFLSTLSSGKPGSAKINNLDADGRRCYTCNSPKHLANACPQRGGKAGGGRGNPKGGGGRGRGNPKGGRGRGGGGNPQTDGEPCKVCKKQPRNCKCDSKDSAAGAASSGSNVNSAAKASDSAIADLCSRLKSGEVKLAFFTWCSQIPRVADVTTPLYLCRTVSNPGVVAADFVSNPGVVAAGDTIHAIRSMDESPGLSTHEAMNNTPARVINCTPNALEVTEKSETFGEAPSTMMRGDEPDPGVVMCPATEAANNLLSLGDDPNRALIDDVMSLCDDHWYSMTGTSVVNMAKVSPVYDKDDKIVLSLCDGLGGIFVSLKEDWSKYGYTKAIAVENNEDAQKVCQATNPKTDSFPGVIHGLNGHNDIFEIKEKHIAAMPTDSLKLLNGTGMCNDFSKLRLLPDRPDYKGPPRVEGTDPRLGLDGKYGKTFRQIIKIIGWCIKHHPNVKFFVENVEFMDMPTHWKEVCDALGTPTIVNAQDHSYTKRNRAYWANFDIPPNYGEGYPPLDPNDCMDPGRKIQRYYAQGKMCTRPLGASWKGDPDSPEAATNRPLLVIDEAHDEPQHIRVEEAEALHGYERGSTYGEGITPMMRLRAIGAGWDINVSRMLLRYLDPQSLEGQVNVYIAQLSQSCTEEQLQQAQHFYNIRASNDAEYVELVKTMAEHDPDQAAKIIALTQHFSCVYNAMLNVEPNSVLDSGAGRHVSQYVNVTDKDNRYRLTSFTGAEQWTSGNGYIPLEMNDDLSGHSFELDITDADYVPETVSSLVSLCKLLRDGWRFELELGSVYGFTPTGHRVALIHNQDDVLRIPHALREGDASSPLPVINQCNRVSHSTSDATTGKFLHRLFNHANSDKIHRTLGVTKGFEQPHTPLPGCYCTSCATANARKRGLSHKVHSIFSAEWVHSVFSAMIVENVAIPDYGDDYPEEFYDTDPEMPPLMTEEYSDSDVYTSSDDSSDTTSDNSSDESDEEDRVPVYNVAYNVAHEAEDSEDEDFHAAEGVYTDSDFKYVAPVPGRSMEAKPPRFDVPALRPFEVMFADEKAYDVIQRGGWKTSLMLLDLASDAWFKEDETTKTAHGDSFRKIMIQNGAHLLDYTRTVYTDGCGSMRHVRDSAIQIGMNHIFIPPYTQSLNEAERIADRAFAAARVNLACTPALPSHMAMALDHVCYMKLRMATTASRNWLTPYQIIKGYAPSITHCVPFFSKAFVTVPKEKRGVMKKKGKAHLRAEDGNLVGYHDPWSTTPKILLDGNRIVHSRNVTYDMTEYKTISGKDPDPDPNRVSTAEDIIERAVSWRMSEPGKSNSKTTVTNNPLNGEGDRRGASPTPDMPSPGWPDSPSDSSLSRSELSGAMWTSPEVCISEMSMDMEDTVQEYGRGHRDSKPPAEFIPHTSYTDNPETVDVLNQTLEQNPRSIFLATMDKIIQLDQKVDIFHAALDDACNKLNAKKAKESDNMAYLIAAAELGHHAQKDMVWSKVLASPQRQDALKALDKELNSLQNNILTEVKATDKDFDYAVRNATPGRLLLDIKRNGTYKVRGVKQGFREDKASEDGPDFNYYSNVVKLSTVRTALCRKRTRTSIIAIKDVSTAFLQAHKYANGKYKFICFKHPVTGFWHYYRQSGPIYGEASAPVRWELTIAPWLVEQGFTRGENDACVFYHEEKDLLVLLYVDDCMADGEPEEVEWIFDLLAERFQCKDTEYVTIDTPQDYLGTDLIMTEDHMYMSMQRYIENAASILNITGKCHDTPIAAPIDEESQTLTPLEKKEFLTGLGMLGWLAQTVRCDIAYVYSRIGQHTATPNQSAIQAVRRAFSYLLGTKDYCIRAPMYGSARDINTITSALSDAVNVWRFYCDTDHAGNSEVQNRRRSQNGLLVTCNTAPVLWQSKASSVSFASERIGEAHADMSSGAVEIYGAGNATCDIMGLSYVVEEMGIEFPFPFTLEIDNDAAKIFALGTAQRSKLKHIDCRQEWVKTLRDRNICTPVHIPSEDNLADIFTKILPRPTFIRLRDQILFPYAQTA